MIEHVGAISVGVAGSQCSICHRRIHQECVVQLICEERYLLRGSIDFEYRANVATFSSGAAALLRQEDSGSISASIIFNKLVRYSEPSLLRKAE